MEEQQLFTGAPEAFIVSGHYVLGEGWICRLQIRRQYEQWEDSRSETYDRLSTDELGQVLEAATARLWTVLGL